MGTPRYNEEVLPHNPSYQRCYNCYGQFTTYVGCVLNEEQHLLCTACCEMSAASVVRMVESRDRTYFCERCNEPYVNLQQHMSECLMQTFQGPSFEGICYFRLLSLVFMPTRGEVIKGMFAVNIESTRVTIRLTDKHDENGGFDNPLRIATFYVSLSGKKALQRCIVNTSTPCVYDFPPDSDMSVGVHIRTLQLGFNRMGESIVPPNNIITDGSNCKVRNTNATPIAMYCGESFLRFVAPASKAYMQIVPGSKPYGIYTRMAPIVYSKQDFVQKTHVTHCENRISFPTFESMVHYYKTYVSFLHREMDAEVFVTKTVILFTRGARGLHPAETLVLFSRDNTNVRVHTLEGNVYERAVFSTLHNDIVAEPVCICNERIDEAVCFYPQTKHIVPSRSLCLARRQLSRATRIDFSLRHLTPYVITERLGVELTDDYTGRITAYCSPSKVTDGYMLSVNTPKGIFEVRMPCCGNVYTTFKEMEACMGVDCMNLKHHIVRGPDRVDVATHVKTSVTKYAQRMFDNTLPSKFSSYEIELKDVTAINTKSLIEQMAGLGYDIVCGYPSMVYPVSYPLYLPDQQIANFAECFVLHDGMLKRTHNYTVICKQHVERNPSIKQYKIDGAPRPPLKPYFGRVVKHRLIDPFIAALMAKMCNAAVCKHMYAYVPHFKLIYYNKNAYTTQGALTRVYGVEIPALVIDRMIEGVCGEPDTIIDEDIQ